MNEDILDVYIFFPESDEKLEGKLHLLKESNILEVYQRSYREHSLETISAVHVLDKRTQLKYTAVQCLWSGSNNDRYFYEINELYEGEFLNKSSDKCFTALAATISYLSEWTNAKVLQTNFSDGLRSIGIKQHQIDLKITQEFTFSFVSFVRTQYTLNEINLKTRSQLIIRSEIFKSRQELFSIYNSFLNFFTLFLSSLPETTSLFFSNADLTVKLLGLPDESESRRRSVLKLDEIHNLEPVLQSYLTKRHYLDKVVSLWEACLKRLDPEMIFLHLTQSFEAFHRALFEKDKQQKESVVSEVNKLFGRTFKTSDRWNQLCRYYHLYNYVKELEINVPFPEDVINFLRRLTDSRNYYTHHSPKKEAFTPFELYKTNRLLRIWMRCLILDDIGVSREKFTYVIAKEKFIDEDLDIYNNDYSMRFFQ